MRKITVENIDIDLVMKKIKNIHLTVYPPDGRVRLAVPLQMDDEAVKTFFISKLPWINKQIKKYSSYEPQPVKQFASGEIHYFLGDEYIINIIETTGKQHIKLSDNKFMDMYVKKDSTVEKREKILTEFYRQMLKDIIPSYIEKWESIMGVKVNEFGVKNMKTKWGTCNVRNKRIWINLELAKKNPKLLEYIIVHEMVHLLEKSHNQVFKNYMNKFLPDWKSIKDELNGLTININK